MVTFQALQIFVFLIPGFLSSKILDTLIVREQEKEFGKLIEALIFSMIIYTLYSFVISTSPIVLTKDAGTISITYDFYSFLLLGLLSIIIPLGLSILITNDLHMKAARYLRISEKTSRMSVWQDVISELNNYIIIDFSDGRRICGWPIHYSETPWKPYMYLADPAWVIEDKDTNESKFVSLDLEGILITPEQRIEFIEVMKQRNTGKEADNG